MAMTPPIVVLGMHRSGTTMLARWLMRAGVWMGRSRDPNEEAHWILRWNERLLAMAGARWDAPEPWLRLLEDEPLRARLQAWLSEAWWGDHGHARGYLGRWGWLAWRGFGWWPARWGFKDPRLTLTWPVWHALFSDARIVHVVRHGVDVAASLVRREQKLRVQTLAEFPRRGPWRVQSPRCWKLEDAFALWEAYLATLERWRNQSEQEQWLTLRYEDILLAPEKARKALGDFLGVADPPALEVRREHAFAYRKDPELRRFAERIRSPMLERWYG
ncbi:MAG: sulfotransferase [Zetaproteobacteria bacterium]|nr:MAG: sulfotransferase [Zetaproteobacteria bacterium]